MTAPKILDTPYAPPRIFGPEYRTASLGILLSVTLVAFEGMSVGVVMPAVSDDLNALDLYGMSFSAFLIAGLFANVIAGLWSDRKGHALPFLLGMGLFVVGMALAGAAVNKELFIASRAIQGLGGGAAIVAIYVMIARVYVPEARPKIFAALSAAWVLPAMVGPAIAGVVADTVGWRWVFYGIVPLVIPALIMLLPALRTPDHGEQAAGDAGQAKGERSRPVAMTLAAAGTAAGAGVLLIGVDRLHNALVSGLVATVAGLVLLGLGLPRLLPRGALRFGRGLPTTIMMRGMFSAAFFGVNSFIPLVLTKVQNFGPSAAGIALTTGALGWSTGSYLQSKRDIAPEKLMRAGAGAVTVGVLCTLLAALPGVSGWIAVPAWIIAGFGMGIGVTTVSVTMLKQSPQAEQGANSAALQVMDTLGSALAIGLGGALINVIGHSSAQISTGFMMIAGIMGAVALAAAVLAVRTRA
ncbi:MFS transporter [Nonomuraea sp. NPDC046570]|uniref:MFS transporter n=1 Tax=Nonomuraea sp. NPDC046570 TaxID=3155255 RepID=UPI0033C06BA8